MYLSLFPDPAGQGMSVAVLEAVALGKQLDAALPFKASGTGTFSSPSPQHLAAAHTALPIATRAFMRGIGELVTPAWVLAAGTDVTLVPGFKPTALESAMSGLFDQARAAGAWAEDV